MSNEIINNKVGSDVQDTMNKVINATKKQVDKLNNGEKVVLKDLIDMVVSETGVKMYKATGIVNTYLDSSDSGMTVERGRNGGAYKGGKPIRVDKRARCESCHQVLRTFNNKSNV